MRPGSWWAQPGALGLGLVSAQRGVAVLLTRRAAPLHYAQANHRHTGRALHRVIFVLLPKERPCLCLLDQEEVAKQDSSPSPCIC